MIPDPDQQRLLWAAACEIAGALAERGILRATLIAHRRRRLLAARDADLPMELYHAPIGAHLLTTSGEWIRDASGWRGARPDEAAYG